MPKNNIKANMEPRMVLFIATKSVLGGLNLLVACSE